MSLESLNGPPKCRFRFVPETPASFDTFGVPMHAATAACMSLGDREHWVCDVHAVRLDRPHENFPFWKDCENERKRRADEMLAAQRRERRRMRTKAHARRKRRRKK